MPVEMPPWTAASSWSCVDIGSAMADSVQGLQQRMRQVCMSWPAKMARRILFARAAVLHAEQRCQRRNTSAQCGCLQGAQPPLLA